MPPSHLFAVVGLLTEGMLNSHEKAFRKMGLAQSFKKSVFNSLLEEYAAELRNTITDVLVDIAAAEGDGEVKH